MGLDGRFKLYFYPRSPCGERLLAFCVVFSSGAISIHALLAESDNDAINGCNPDIISIHALLAESDPHRIRLEMACRISIHALLAESDLIFSCYYNTRIISIHALLAESDGPMERGQVYYINFYPRSPCGERQPTAARNDKNNIFLSTLSLRRATRLPTAFRTPHHKYLSTLSLRRATETLAHKLDR